ncbi:unnamed protein product [Dibothriocephalus latus]|uniref:Uncharacterized protein n=1 Tax=Dibothriocephalus latus TaxID=60516 RepID=A0A3P7NZ98_DIBLA|nr:unnamed protein product [Dibothriocephalus latus]
MDARKSLKAHIMPPKELHLAVNDILLANVNSCAQEEGAPYENSDEEDCEQAIGWIEMDDPVKVTCSSEPSLPAAQLEWLVNGEVLQPVNFWETKSTVDQSPSTRSGDQCQCGHLCGSQEEANVTTRHLNGSVIFRMRTFTVRICRMGNQDESL